MSWGSGCKVELLVVVEVVAAEFLLLVPLPVLVEVAVGDDGAQVQDGRLHPDKTKIVYCQDSNRRGSYEHTEFSFLGFTFRRRGAWGNQGTLFSSFQPAISKDALNRINAEVRSWRLHNRTGHDLAGLAARINPIVRGWMQYYGAFYRSAIYPLLQRINAYLVRWIRKKYKRLRRRRRPSGVGGGSSSEPRACSRTGNGFLPSRLSGDQDDKSPVTRDCHAGICGSRAVRFRPATRQMRVSNSNAAAPIVSARSPVRPRPAVT